MAETYEESLRKLLEAPDLEVVRSIRKYVDEYGSIWRRGEVAPYPILKIKHGETEESFKKRVADAQLLILAIFTSKDGWVRIFCLPKSNNEAPPMCFALRGKQLIEEELVPEMFRDLMLAEIEGVEDDAPTPLDIARKEMREALQDLRDLRATQNGALKDDKEIFESALHEATLAYVGTLEVYAEVAKQLREDEDEEEEGEEEEVPEEPTSPQTPAAIAAAPPIPGLTAPLAVEGEVPPGASAQADDAPPTS